MKRSQIVLLVIVAFALLGASTAVAQRQATVVKFSAVLSAGKEIPHPKSPKPGAAGSFTATLSGTTLKWTLTWKNLTGPATEAHIHIGKPGISGNVMVPLCPPGCSSPNHGTWKLTKSQVKLMESGGTYVNVHTAKNINGEIRGQITRVV